MAIECANEFLFVVDFVRFSFTDADSAMAKCFIGGRIGNGIVL